MKTLFWVWLVLSSLNIGYTAYQKTGSESYAFALAIWWSVSLPTAVFDIWQRTR